MRPRRVRGAQFRPTFLSFHSPARRARIQYHNIHYFGFSCLMNVAAATARSKFLECGATFGVFWVEILCSHRSPVLTLAVDSTEVAKALQ